MVINEGRDLEQDRLWPAPEIVGCYFDEGFSPALAAMHLKWSGPACAEWQLPGGLVLAGPPPARFGLHIERFSPSAYTLSLVWNTQCLWWPSLTREVLLASSLRPLLAAMGTNLLYLLEQPIVRASPHSGSRLKSPLPPSRPADSLAG
jgi:hypothetical protein